MVAAGVFVSGDGDGVSDTGGGSAGASVLCEEVSGTGAAGAAPVVGNGDSGGVVAAATAAVSLGDGDDDSRASKLEGVPVGVSAFTDGDGEGASGSCAVAGPCPFVVGVGASGTDGLADGFALGDGDRGSETGEAYDVFAFGDGVGGGALATRAVGVCTFTDGDGDGVSKTGADTRVVPFSGVDPDPALISAGARSGLPGTGPDSSATWGKVRTRPPNTPRARRLVKSRASKVAAHNAATMIRSH